jgi:hypothetical protein
MALLFVGKLLIALGLCYQAYTLYENKASATLFDNQLAIALKPCHIIPADIQHQIKTHLRLVLVALLGFSGLMVFFKTALLKIPVLLGLLTLFWVRHWPLTAVPSYRDHAFWELAATIGGIIFLIGADHDHSHSSKKTNS